MSTAASISVIMPFYNPLPYLGAAVRSVLAQTTRDWELIAVDDGSTDGAGDMLAEVADERIRVVRLASRGDVSHAVNVGIQASRGRWIARMDADDLCCPTRLARQLAFLQSHPDVDLVGTGSFITDVKLRIVAMNRPPAADGDIRRLVGIAPPLLFGALMGKAEWWRRWRMNERIHGPGHEFDLYLRSHVCSKFANIPEPLYVYRFVNHTQSVGKMTWSVYNKCKSLLRALACPALSAKAALGLLSMVPRPLLYALKALLGSETPLVKSRRWRPTPQDHAQLERILRVVRDVAIPVRTSAGLAIWRC